MATTKIQLTINGTVHNDVTIEKAAELVAGRFPHRGDKVNLNIQYTKGFCGPNVLKDDDAIGAIMLGQSLKHNRYWGMNLGDNQFSLNDKMVTIGVIKNGERYVDIGIEEACRLTYACRPWKGDKFALYLKFSSFGGDYTLKGDDAISAIQLAHDVMTGQWWADMSKKSA